MAGIIAVTGHRPDKLGGYNSAVMERLTGLAVAWLADEQPEQVITGMAQGWDQAVAYACLQLGLAYVAAVPFYDQDARWPPDARLVYCRLLAAAAERVVVSGGGYSAAKLHFRNRWMVDRCDKVGALWNGDMSGGTFETICYANKVGRPVVNLWERWETANAI